MRRLRRMPAGARRAGGGEADARRSAAGRGVARLRGAGARARRTAALVDARGQLAALDAAPRADRGAADHPGVAAAQRPTPPARVTTDGAPVSAFGIVGHGRRRRRECRGRDRACCRSCSIRRSTRTRCSRLPLPVTCPPRGDRHDDARHAPEILVCAVRDGRLRDGLWRRSGRRRATSGSAAVGTAPADRSDAAARAVPEVPAAPAAPPSASPASRRTWRAI